MNASLQQVFQGLTLVELSSVLAGPAVGMFFAELGARVIKVENATTGGDITRRWKSPGASPVAPFSAYYASVNWGKTVVLKDLNDPQDRDWVMQQIQQADVVLSNFRRGKATAFGMGYEQLRKHRPDIIYAELTGFPEGDDRPAFDIVLQAESGFLFMTGEPDRPPVKMPVALIDLLAAHQLKEGILLALLLRARTGEGRRVRTSLFESALAALANQATNWLMAGHLPQPMGTAHPNIAPYGDCMQTADGHWIVLAAGTERHFQSLCAVLDLPDLLEEARFASNAERVRHRQALYSELEKAVHNWTLSDLTGALQRAGVPVGHVKNMRDVFNDPAAKQMILKGHLPDGSPMKCVRTVAFHLD